MKLFFSVRKSSRRSDLGKRNHYFRQKKLSSKCLSGGHANTGAIPQILTTKVTRYGRTAGAVLARTTLRHLYPHPSTTAGVTVDGCGYKFNEKTYVPKRGFPRDERKHAQYHYAFVTLRAVFLLLACGADVCRFLTSDRFAFIANHLMQVCVRPWIRT